MVKCKCGKEIIFIGYETIEVNENGDINNDYGVYDIPLPSERNMKRTKIFACKNYPSCIYSEKMTYSQMRKFEDEQNENEEIEELLKNRKKKVNYSPLPGRASPIRSG